MYKKILGFVLLVSMLFFSLVGCGEEENLENELKNEQEIESNIPQAEEEQNTEEQEVEEGKEETSQNHENTVHPKIIIRLEDGRTIKLELYPEYAPLTVENFLKLVDERYYTNVVFHRIIANFMIQTGMLGYDEENNQLYYKETKETIVGEFSNNGYSGNSLNHTLGTISMARNGFDNDSASAQFFICSTDCTPLDGDYAPFGRTIDDESNQVVIDLSYSATTKFEGMENFPFELNEENNQYELIIISSIERLEEE